MLASAQAGEVPSRGADSPGWHRAASALAGLERARPVLNERSERTERERRNEVPRAAAQR